MYLFNSHQSKNSNTGETDSKNVTQDKIMQILNIEFKESLGKQLQFWIVNGVRIQGKYNIWTGAFKAEWD